MSDERRFPIQGGPAIPWAEAEIAYQSYVRFYGPCQTLERLAERDGFGCFEYLCLRYGLEPGDEADAIRRRRGEPGRYSGSRA